MTLTIYIVYIDLAMLAKEEGGGSGGGMGAFPILKSSSRSMRVGATLTQ